MTDEYLHDLKRMAQLINELVRLGDKLYVDVENKIKEKEDARDNSMDNSELGAVSGRPVASGTVATAHL